MTGSAGHTTTQPNLFSNFVVRSGRDIGSLVHEFRPFSPSIAFAARIVCILLLMSPATALAAFQTVLA